MTIHTPAAPSPIHRSAPGASPAPSRRRWRWGVPLVAIPVVLGTWTLLRSPAAEPDPTPALPVAVITPQVVSSYTTEHTYTGELVAARTSRLSFEAGGTVVALPVDEGERVTAGQVLAQLDTRSLQAQHQGLVAQRDRARAQLQELEAGPRLQDIAAAQATVADLDQQVALAQLQRGRREDLYARGAISREELDQQSFNTSSLEQRRAQAQSQLDELLAGTRPEQIQAQAAQVRQLDAQIQAVEVDLAKSTLTAPFAGQINQRLADEGMVVAGGSPVLELVEAGLLEARIGLPAQVAADLTVGSQQELTVGDRTVPAILTALLPALDGPSRTVTARFTLTTAAPLPLGQTVRLTVVQTQPAEGFWVPSTALVEGAQGLWSVYVVVAAADPTAPATVAARPVEIVHTNGEGALVRGLLHPGDQVIPAGSQRVVPGQAVEVLANADLESPAPSP